MNHRRLLIAAAILVGLLSGCGKQASKTDGPYGGQSIAWYVSHPKEFKAQSAWCSAQTIQVQTSKVCSTVARAQRRLEQNAIKHTKDLF